MEKLTTDMRFTIYNIFYKRILVVWIATAFIILLSLLFSHFKVSEFYMYAICSITQLPSSCIKWNCVKLVEKVCLLLETFEKICTSCMRQNMIYTRSTKVSILYLMLWRCTLSDANVIRFLLHNFIELCLVSRCLASTLRKI